MARKPSGELPGGFFEGDLNAKAYQHDELVPQESYPSCSKPQPATDQYVAEEAEAGRFLVFSDRRERVRQLLKRGNVGFKSRQ